MSARDSPPSFPLAQPSFFIHEDEPPGGIIATVRAESKLPLSYSIVPGMTNASNSPAISSVDSFGQIRILRALDREMTPSFTLAVKAQTRKSSPPLVAHMDVHIQLRDINDNAPRFESNPYRASVVENCEVGTDLIQVRAVPKGLTVGLCLTFVQCLQCFVLYSR